MPHELTRDEAWFVIKQIGPFDLGAMGAWQWWFKNVWRRLEASKWFEELCVRGSPVYATQQRITLFALRWIAEDFVSVLDGASDPEWDEWISMLDLDADKLLAVVRGHERWSALEKEIREDMGEPDVLDDFKGDDSAMQTHMQELYAQLLPQAACFAAALHRQRLVPWLRRIFVRPEHLFQSLWAGAHCGTAGPFDEACGHHEDKYITAEDDWPFAHESDPDLTPELAATLNSIAMAAFTEGVGFGAETGLRMKAFEWVEGGCRIRSQGEPQYAGPWLD